MRHNAPNKHNSFLPSTGYTGHLDGASDGDEWLRPVFRSETCGIGPGSKGCQQRMEQLYHSLGILPKDWRYGFKKSQFSAVVGGKTPADSRRRRRRHSNCNAGGAAASATREGGCTQQRTWGSERRQRTIQQPDTRKNFIRIGFVLS